MSVQALVQHSCAFGVCITQWQQGKPKLDTMQALELPLRLAAQQLGALASMSHKVHLQSPYPHIWASPVAHGLSPETACIRFLGLTFSQWYFPGSIRRE